jgi:hypothetical protein
LAVSALPQSHSQSSQSSHHLYDVADSDTDPIGWKYKAPLRGIVLTVVAVNQKAPAMSASSEAFVATQWNECGNIGELSIRTSVERTGDSPLAARKWTYELLIVSIWIVSSLSRT